MVWISLVTGRRQDPKLGRLLLLSFTSFSFTSLWSSDPHHPRLCPTVPTSWLAVHPQSSFLRLRTFSPPAWHIPPSASFSSDLHCSSSGHIRTTSVWFHLQNFCPVHPNLQEERSPSHSPLLPWRRRPCGSAPRFRSCAVAEHLYFCVEETPLLCISDQSSYGR